eukprot:SAG25_NODE_12007_length_289_cov_69.936842_1_plen_85_part_10
MKIGDVIEALETKVNAKGVTRVRLEAGWVSEKAGDGTVLLERLEEEETDEEEDDTDTETEVTATDTDGGSSAPARKPRAKAKKAA